MFIVQPRFYTVKEVAALLDVTPAAITYSIRQHKRIRGVRCAIQTRRGSFIRIPASVYRQLANVL